MSEEAEAAASTADEILVVTSPQISGKRIERTYGLVSGNTIRARHIGKDIMAGLRNIVGGEVVEYAMLLAESREQALDRMKEKAAALGANAIISLQFQTSVIMGGAAEMMAYGALRSGSKTHRATQDVCLEAVVDGGGGVGGAGLGPCCRRASSQCSRHPRR